jgi:hypothetical protein
MKRLAGALFASFLMPLAAPADERIGPEIILEPTGSYVEGGPAVASDGLGAYVVWIADNELRGARVDDGGNVSGPFLLADGTSGNKHGTPAVASNGRGALVAWGDIDGNYADINIVLLDVDGRPLHGEPFRIDRGSSSTPLHVHVAFDGTLYRVLWQRFSGSGRLRNFTRRIGPDGSSWTKKVPVKVRGMARYPWEPNLSCLDNGQCLITWVQTAGPEHVQGARIVGDQVIDASVLLLMHNSSYHDIVAGNHQYLVVALQDHWGCGEPQCPVNAAAVRVGADGTALDPEGFTIDNPVGGEVTFVASVRAGFDGERYLATFISQPEPWCAWNGFGARIAADGTVSNPEAPGSVVTDANGVIFDVDIAGTRTAAVAAWTDQRDLTSCMLYTSPSVRAQRVFPHPAAPLPQRNIGAIGPQDVAEQQVLRFTVGAPGLDPDATTVNVSNLPPGAIFDAATRTFQWRPYANESGTYAGVRFEASDASQTISEDVTINVAEAGFAICGYVDFFGVPMANVALQLKGGGGKPRTVTSRADGSFCFFQVVQGSYKIGLDRLSSRDFQPVRQAVVVANGDVEDLLVSVRRRVR